MRFRGSTEDTHTHTSTHSVPPASSSITALVVSGLQGLPSPLHITHRNMMTTSCPFHPTISLTEWRRVMQRHTHTGTFNQGQGIGGAVCCCVPSIHQHAHTQEEERMRGGRGPCYLRSSKWLRPWCLLSAPAQTQIINCASAGKKRDGWTRRGSISPLSSPLIMSHTDTYIHTPSFSS